MRAPKGYWTAQDGPEPEGLEGRVVRLERRVDEVVGYLDTTVGDHLDAEDMHRGSKLSLLWKILIGVLVFYGTVLLIEKALGLYGLAVLFEALPIVQEPETSLSDHLDKTQALHHGRLEFKGSGHWDASVASDKHLSDMRQLHLVEHRADEYHSHPIHHFHY